MDSRFRSNAARRFAAGDPTRNEPVHLGPRLRDGFDAVLARAGA